MWNFLTPAAKPVKKEPEEKLPERNAGESVVGKSLTVYLEPPVERAKQAEPEMPREEEPQPQASLVEEDFDPDEIEVITVPYIPYFDIYDEEDNIPGDMAGQGESTSAPFVDLAVAYKVISDDGTGEITEQEKIVAVDTLHGLRNTEVLDFMSREVKRKDKIIELLNEYAPRSEDREDGVSDALPDEGPDADFDFNDFLRPG